MQPDLPRARDLAAALSAMLDGLPGRYADPEGHAAGVAQMHRVIQAADPRGQMEEGRLKAFGIMSTSTAGVHSTVRNWIGRVRALSAQNARGAA